jgi:hypothetical protein
MSDDDDAFASEIIVVVVVVVASSPFVAFIVLASVAGDANVPVVPVVPVSASSRPVPARVSYTFTPPPTLARRSFIATDDSRDDSRDARVAHSRVVGASHRGKTLRTNGTTRARMDS